MDDLLKFIQGKNKITKDDIFEIMEKFGERNEVFAIKIDGLRESNRYTTLITDNSNIDNSVRHDAATIEESVFGAIKKYRINL